MSIKTKSGIIPSEVKRLERMLSQVPPEAKRLDRLVLWRKNWGANGRFARPIIYPRRMTPRGSDK